MKSISIGDVYWLDNVFYPKLSDTKYEKQLYYKLGIIPPRPALVIREPLPYDRNKHVTVLISSTAPNCGIKVNSEDNYGMESDTYQFIPYEPHSVPISRLYKYIGRLTEKELTEILDAFYWIHTPEHLRCGDIPAYFLEDHEPINDVSSSINTRICLNRIDPQFGEQSRIMVVDSSHSISSSQKKEDVAEPETTEEPMETRNEDAGKEYYPKKPESNVDASLWRRLELNIGYHKLKASLKMIYLNRSLDRLPESDMKTVAGTQLDESDMKKVIELYNNITTLDRCVFVRYSKIRYIQSAFSCSFSIAAGLRRLVTLVESYSAFEWEQLGRDKQIV